MNTINRKNKKKYVNPFVPRKKKFSEIAQILVCHRYWKENNFLFLKNFCISFISWDMRCTLQCTLGIWAKVGTFPVRAFGTLYCTCVHYTVLWANRHFFHILDRTQIWQQNNFIQVFTFFTYFIKTAKLNFFWSCHRYL